MKVMWKSRIQVYMPCSPNHPASLPARLTARSRRSV
jgi:hypothetical protein